MAPVGQIPAVSPVGFTSFKGLKAAGGISQTPTYSAVSHSEKPLLTQVTAQRYPVTQLCQQGQQGAEPAKAELHTH